MSRIVSRIFSLFTVNHNKSSHPSPRMPPFSNSLQKLQDSLNDLKSEINQYHCPTCGFKFESNEESTSTTETKSFEGGRSRDVCNDQSKQDEKKQVQKHGKRDITHERWVSSDEKKQLQNRILELEKECESLTLKNNKYETLISEQECTIGQQFEKISELNDIKSKQDFLDELEKTKSEQQKEIYRLREVAEESAEEEQKLKQDILEKDKHIEVLKRTQKVNEEELEKLSQRLQDERKSHVEQLRSRQMEIDKLSSKLAEKDRRNCELARIKLEMEEKCIQLERELEMRSRKEIAVGFHTTLAPAMSSLILGGLTSRLTDRLTAEKVDLVRQAYAGSPDINFPLLVVCVNVSRIGADAKEALKGIPKAKDVALLVFHHKEVHALPSQTSDKILTGADFSGLGSIIDLAFLSGRGIYECELNTVGIERVASFLLQYKTQRKY